MGTGLDCLLRDAEDPGKKYYTCTYVRVRVSMRVALLLLPFLLGLAGCFNEEAGSLIPHDACAQLCDGTYPEHTYPRVSALAL